MIDGVVGGKGEALRVKEEMASDINAESHMRDPGTSGFRR